MTKKSVTLILAGLFITAAILTANPGPKRGARDMMKHARFGIYMAEKNLYPAHVLLKIKDKIGLSEEQVNKMEEMQESFMEYAIKRKADIKVKEMKLHSYLKEDKVNRKTMEKIIREITGMKTGMQIAHMNHLLDVKDILTAEQLQKIEDFRKERRLRGVKERQRRHRGRERTR